MQTLQTAQYSGGMDGLSVDELASLVQRVYDEDANNGPDPIPGALSTTEHYNLCAYLQANPDVAQAVLQHWLERQHAENRLWGWTSTSEWFQRIIFQRDLRRVAKGLPN